MKHPFSRATLAAVSVLAGLLTACDPVPSNRENRPAGAASTSPAQTAQEIHRLRQARDYTTVGEMIHSDHRDETIQTLRAIDAVVDAHDRLQAAAKERYGARVYRSWNLASMANNQGLFSRNVRVIGQSLDSDRATVTLQEADHVPLVRAHFVRIEGQWRLNSQIRDAELVAPLNALADRIDNVAERIRGGLSPMGYFDAVHGELMPALVAIGHGEPDSDIRMTDATEAQP